MKDIDEGNNMKTEIGNYMDRLIFRLRWLIMSDRERYAYLWNRTRRSWQHIG